MARISQCHPMRMILRTWHDHSRGWRSRWLRQICQTDVIHITVQIGDQSYHCDRYRSGWYPTYPLWAAYEKSQTYTLHRQVYLGQVKKPVLNEYPLGNTLSTMMYYFFKIGSNHNCATAVRSVLNDNGLNVPDYITAPLDLMEYVDDNYRFLR